MSTTITGKPNQKPGYCRDCNSRLEPGQGILVEISYYDWDNPDSDVAGSILQCRYEVCCQNATQCARRVVEQGTNTAALRHIARDFEHLGELANQAKAILAEYAELAQQQAVANDLAAREAGYGAIGH